MKQPVVLIVYLDPKSLFKEKNIPCQFTKVYANIFSFFRDTIEINVIDHELMMNSLNFVSFSPLWKSVNDLCGSHVQSRRSWCDFWLAYNSICVITYHTLLSTIMHPGNPFFFHWRGGIFLLFFRKREEGNLRNRSTFYCHKWVGKDYINECTLIELYLFYK